MNRKRFDHRRKLPPATLGILLLAFAWPFVAAAQQGQPDSREKILEDQTRLAEQYRLLEEKLFSLYQYEQDQNPNRSELLQRAFQQSKQNLTLEQFNAAARFLQQAKLRDAEQSQLYALDHLQQLLTLLQSEDRSKRVREEIDRYQQYLNEANRILRVQQGIRGQAEGGVDPSSLDDAQQKNADRTGELAREVEQNEEPNPAEASSEDKPGKTPGQPPQPSERDGQPADEKPADGQPADGQPSPGSDKQPAESPPADAAPAEPPQGQSGDPSAPPQTTPPNPVRQRLQQAQQKMRQAQEKLEQAQRDDSVEAMREAERELAEAIRELEEILRQLREEEIERALASLESRFRKMLEIQVKIYDETVRLGEVPETQRDAEFEIRAGKLAVDEKALVTEASRALLLLQDDGTSIAIPETVRQMQLDMQQTADRLSAAKVNEITQSIEQDIIETLNFLVEAFAQAQRDQQQGADAPPPGQPGQAPGQQPLVDQLAELKLIRGLQQRIHNRHNRYAQLLEQPGDPVGQTSDPELQQALRRLSERQLNLYQVTRDIVLGKNK